ncbi:MAG: oxygen-dependent coproporphyrinogen oxidase [Cyanobacteria bacterium J06639_14]
MIAAPTQTVTQEQRTFVEQPQQPLWQTSQLIFENMFEAICEAIATLDEKPLMEQTWKRENGRWVMGQGDDTALYVDRALQGGNVFEKAGINYVAIAGNLPPGMNFQTSGALTTAAADQQSGGQGQTFFATGSSVVIHPKNPMAPTVHANYRYFQVGDRDRPDYWWFGGGADLTPTYLFVEDAIHFHQIHKDVCDKHEVADHAQFKQNCDDYFYIRHRGESRGIGGIFFDHLRDDNTIALLDFVKDCTEVFVPAYFPLVERRKDLPFTQSNKQWQRVVRGRYVEFILTSDRGMKFGLESGMVTPQSVFNCMPAFASWEYDDEPQPGSPEALLKEVLRQPREWV